MNTSINLVTIFSLLLSFSATAQTRDTVFIKKDKVFGSSQSIYFEKNKKSKFYKDLEFWKFRNYDSSSYQYSLKYLKDNNNILIRRKPIMRSSKWIALKQYKGQFYAYYPCDFYSFFRASFNDSTYIDWTGEGPIANQIRTEKKIDDYTYKYELTGVQSTYRLLIIHIIDRSKGIAVFEETNPDGIKLFYLMISSEKLKTVPFIINNCRKGKQPELEFDKPDFARLLNKKK